MASNVTTSKQSANHQPCDHKNQLERQHRTWRQKLIGVKEVYRCTRCGEKITIR